MKQIAPFLILAAATVAWSVPAHAQPENRSIGENSREAKRAAKQYQKAGRKAAKRQQKQMKRYQKAQREAARRQQRHH
jgi:cytidylate kinase